MDKLSLAGVICALLLVGGCTTEDTTIQLTPAEFQFLGEDVIDMMTVVFQAGEQAYIGDLVDPGDVVDPPVAGNDFTVTYILPIADRLNLGRGSGRVELQILEDGTPVQDPLGFTYAGSTAVQVQVIYRITYRGEAQFTTRGTDVDLTVDLVVTRDGANQLTQSDYIIEGFVDLDQTLTDISVDFRADGAPVDGIRNDGGSADIQIDDPDVIQIMDATAALFDSFLQVNGFVRDCCGYADNFLYTELGL